MFGSIIPEPFAVPPTMKRPLPVSTVIACSFGNGSVVMSACAMSLPLPRASAAAAVRMPGTTLSILRFTPITPVDATSTCSTPQPRAAAASLTIRSASAMPCVPVHAFAHPLLTTIARAMPPVRSRCRRDTRTGAALARFVVKMPAAEAARSAASTVRSRAPAFALIPQCSAAEVKPCGAVTPPAAGVNVTAPAGVASPERTARRRDASAMERRQRYAGLPVAGERQHHRVLAAPAELRAGPAIGVDFLGQPDMRNDGETELHEIGRYVGERTEL